MLKLLVLAVTITLSAPVFSQSQQPKSQLEKQPAAKDERGTEQQPLVIKGFPAGKSKEESDAAAKEGAEVSAFRKSFGADIRSISVDSEWNVKLTIALVVIAFFQAAFFVWQLLIIQRSANDATLAANAAEASAKALRDEFISTHRPRVRVKHVLPQGPISPGDLRVKLVMTNVGNTVANLFAIRMSALVVSSNRELPPRPNLDLPIGVPKEPERRMESGMTYAYPAAPMGVALTDYDISAIRLGRCCLYCYGHIEYTDTEKRVKATAFCRIFKVVDREATTYETLGRFVVYDHPDYEYQD